MRIAISLCSLDLRQILRQEVEEPEAQEGQITMVQMSETLMSLPEEVLSASGAVFYSSPPAFKDHRPVYILGLNPGGDPSSYEGDTVRQNIESWQHQSEPWSAYVDELWGGTVPGEHGMQPRIRHLAAGLGLDLRLTPASNVVFVRSATEANLQADKAALLAACWPVHARVIESLGVRAILCLGGTAGQWVREQTGAHDPLDEFRECNKRGRWSVAHRSQDGLAVCTLTHPGRADWRSPDADPTPMVKRVLAAVGV